MHEPHYRPPGQQPCGYPPAPQRRRGGLWWVVGLVVVMLLVVGGVMTFRIQKQSGAPAAASTIPVTSSAVLSAPVTPAAPDISVATLPSYLASAQQISGQIAGVAVTAGPLIHQPFGGFTVDPFECAGAVIPGSDIVYRGSGFTAFAGQPVSDTSNEHKVIQAVTLLGAMSSTETFFNTQVGQWKQCAGRSVSVDDTKGKTETTVDAFDLTDGIASVRITPTGGDQRQCQHAMTTARTVVVDVRVCIPDLGANTAREIARGMRAAITGAR